jgi:hypothetical protein
MPWRMIWCLALHQMGDRMTRSQAHGLMYVLHKKTFDQSHWQEVGSDGTARWVKHVDYARLKAVEDLLIVRPSKGKGDRGVWELTEKGKRRAERAAKALADRVAG